LDKKAASHHSAVQRAIDEIASDNTSGAAEILRRAAEVFRSLASSDIDIGRLSDQSARQLVIKTCIALLKAQPRMATLANLANRVAYDALNAREVLSAAAASAASFIQQVDAAVSRASDRAARLIKEDSVVLTHSRSSTVVAAFKKARAQGRSFGVIATESRPAFEGRRLAASVAELGVSVVLVADAAATLELSRADFVMIGADAITPQFLVNKIGTSMIALAAREMNRPVYALSDLSKLINTDLFSGADDDRHDPDELWADPPSGVAIINRYFEPVPIELFTKVITEEGLLDASEVRKHAEGRQLNKELWDALKDEGFLT
jgi:translation initiation factor 2B subunit (eIF-2B alpha/beta/delta family)